MFIKHVFLLLFALTTTFARLCHANETFDSISEAHKPSIQEAIATIAPAEDLDNISFKPLLGGLSKSKLFQAEIKGNKYVFRLLDESKSIERRKSELDAHRIGAKLNIAPELFYADQVPLVMVMKFIEGRTLSREDLDNDEIVSKVMQTIKKFHNYHGEEHLLRRTKIEVIHDLPTRYTKKGAVFPSCFAKLHSKFQEDASTLNTARQPSHGDFNPRNILIAEEGNIYLIDWAEASIDSPFLDIGWLSCLSAANDDQIKNLLKEYLGRDPKESEIQETIFFRDATMLLVATLWIARQEEEDQEKLDTLLGGPLKKGTEYIKDGITADEIASKQGLDLTIYALGWLKEFINNQDCTVPNPVDPTVV